MAKILTRVILFITPLILFLLGLLVVASKNHRFKPSAMYFHKEFEQAFQEGDFDVVALGNSKLLSAVDNDILEEGNKHRVALLGYSSSNISVSKLTLESYLDKCATKPKLVLLEVSWFTFNPNRTNFHSVVGDLFLEDLKLWRNYGDYKSDLLFPKILGVLKISLKRAIGIEPKFEEKNYVSYFPDSSPLSVDYTFKESELDVVFPDHRAGIDPLLLRDFNSIINMCNNQNIDLILFTAPEDEEYSKRQKDSEEIKEIYRSAATLNPNIYFLDYTLGGDLYDKKFEKWLSNSHHVNEKILFSEELLKDIRARTRNSVYR